MKATFAILAALLATAVLATAAPLKALIVDGQNNHDWKGTTPLLKKYLEETGLFTVDVATTPQDGSGVKSFKPKFDDYALVVSNYNGEPWSDETKAAFEKYMRNGGGFVTVHAANNSFPEWKEYNRIIGLGGWGGRNEKSGPYVRYWQGKIVRDVAPGSGGSHGAQRPFIIDTRDTEHPITKGIPLQWMHATDELYDRLRGPAENLTVLATAFAEPGAGGSGHNEPMLMVVEYEKGRTFHTTLGHSNAGYQAMRCTGFIVTFQRGAEWAATGKVTQKIPEDFPTRQEVRIRK